MPNETASFPSATPAPQPSRPAPAKSGSPAGKGKAPAAAVMPPTAPRELTPQQKRVREEVLKKKEGCTDPALHYEQTALIRNGNDGEIKVLVMTPANPHLSLLREFFAGKLTLEELIESVDASVCSDEKTLAGYEFQAMPFKPAALVEKEDELRSKVDPSDLYDALAELRAKMAARTPVVADWMRTCEKVALANTSRLWSLKDMYARQKTRNQVYAARLLAAISTHETP